MALAHPMQHRHAEDDDTYAVDLIGVESMAAGSVTSFVRKLFQMVQAECDSIVGFVADGTAFEVKDPRRLEQDILPKYFRHSRFQSLVRQLNFYSFKKISKERSVWIYKHAFFRRDEPELLHALKRKTNQHAAPSQRIGGGAGMLPLSADGEDAMRLSSDISSEPPHDANTTTNKPRPRGPTPPHHHPPSSTNPAMVHHTGPSSVPHNTAPPRQPRPQHLRSPNKATSIPTSTTPSSTRPYHSSTNSRGSAGGGPSVGGVGGAAAPCYGGGRGAVPSRTPGYAWAGAGGHPVTTGGGVAGPAEYMGDTSGGGGIHGAARAARESTPGAAPASSAAHHHHLLHHGREESASSHAFRQGPAIGDSSGGAGGSSGGGGAVAAAAAADADREQAFALWGLSALCQVASATEASGGVGSGAGHVDGGGRGGGRSRVGGVERSPRGFGSDQQRQKRPCRASAAAATRRGWGFACEGDGGNDETSEEEDEGEEDGITSAERDDSSASCHSRSASRSSCASSNSSGLSSAGSSPRHSPTRRHGAFAMSSVTHGDDPNAEDVDEEDDRDSTFSMRRAGPGTGPRTSGSGGVFCPTWDWGRAACDPGARLPGSFVDRRFEQVGSATGAYGGDGRADMEDDEESSKTEGEDMDDEEEERREAGYQDAKFSGEASSPSMVEARATAGAPHQRNPEADLKAEVAVGLDGVGELFAHFCTEANSGSSASESVFLATVTNSGDGGLREMAVFCAGPAGKAPDSAAPAALARQVSSFLRAEAAVAQDLRVYAEALDPATVDVVGRAMQRKSAAAAEAKAELPAVGGALDDAKLLRVFCRYAACRLGRAHEVASNAATSAGATVLMDGVDAERHLQQQAVAQRVSPLLDACRWMWWRAAVRFS